MMIPKTINAIGDNNMNPLFSYPNAYNPVFSIGSPNTLNPNKVPDPSNSLKNPTIISIKPYPAALPTPSKNDCHGPLARANASKRPMMIQLVIINPTKTDKVLLSSYENAFNTWSTIITKAATTTNCTMILILEGMIFLIREITTFPTPNTAITETAIITEAFNCAVIANAEQIPST